ncbi:MAG: class I SAM-dependent methyltransferase [Candidatus Omnitrophota bacterium]|nr:class I SAM-dependent methyltransferase [Candidatus Omnitrophota bacterium]
MIHSFKWLVYYLKKPFHSFYHKKIKRRASKYAKNNDSYKKALNEISEYTGKDVNVIESISKHLLEDINAQDYDKLSEKELTEFYQKNRYYLYELPLWNAGCGRSYAVSYHLAPCFKKKGYKKILDFGGGTGDICLYLANQGFNMYYCDVNESISNFAKWRADKQKLNIQFIHNDEIKADIFDCIISFDVFEHFKNLPKKIRFLTAALRVGGALIFNIELSGDGLHLSENKKYKNIKVLDEMLKKHGLIFDKKFKDIYFYVKTKG